MVRTGDVHLQPQLGTAEVARARGQVRDFCRDMPPEVGGRAERLAANLVANALQRGQGAVNLRLSAGDRSLLVEVVDDANPPSPPDPRRGTAGTRLGEAFSITWGEAPATPLPTPRPSAAKRSRPRLRLDRGVLAAWLVVAAVSLAWVVLLAYLGGLAFRAASQG